MRLRIDRRPGAIGGMLVVAAAAAVLGFPPVASADAPSGTGGPPPTVDSSGTLISIVQVVGVLAIAVVILVVVAMLLARIGGRPSGKATPSAPQDGRVEAEARSRPATLVALIVMAVAAVAGIGIGREVAYEQSAGGFLPGVFILGVVILVEAAIVIIGVLALIIRRGHPSLAVGTTFAAAVLIAAGGVAGRTTAAQTGGLYQPPVVLRAAGEAHLTVNAGGVSFVPRQADVAECMSLPDSREIEAISALDLGELGAGTLRGSIHLPPPGGGDATASFFIDGGDLPDGSTQPTWSGTVRLDNLGPDRSSGTAVFEALAWNDSAAKPGADGSPSPPPGDWPPTITGSFTWRCTPWA